MVAVAEVEAERDVVYEIELRRQLPESVRAQFPAMLVRTTGAQTALRREVGEPAQLDALLQKLSSVGVVLTGIHRLPRAAQDRVAGGADSFATRSASQDAERAGGATYEVRVAGELGESLLRYLCWPHYVVPEQTQVRLALGSAELLGFLRACTDCGTSIERVRRVDPAPRAPSAVREMSDA